MVPVSDLRPLHAQFRNLPCQAVHASLAGVVPAGGLADWAPEDNYWFNNRVAGKMFVGRVIENMDDNIIQHYCHEDTFIIDFLYEDDGSVRVTLAEFTGHL